MRSKRWDPARDDLDGLLFEGAPALLGQLDDLVLRPRLWWRETLLPIIYLTCEPAARNPLDGITDRLRQARGTLYSSINGRETPLADNGQPAMKSIRPLLDGAVADLSQRRGRGRPLRFPHYSLAVWLASLIMNHATPPPPDKPWRRADKAMKDFMKGHIRLQNITTKAEIGVIDEFPRWVRIPILLLPPLGIWLMSIFWHPPRWVARNRIASKHGAGSVRELAQKLMEQGSGEHQHSIEQDEIDRLLVDAFMEDLRRGYRRTTLVGVGRRRTTYPVLLIDKIGSTTDGLRLLELIGDSRTDYLRKDTAGPGRQPRKRAYFHPLLIIVQGDSSALNEMMSASYRPEDHGGYPMADIKFYYNQWYRTLTDPDRTWLIPLKVPIEDPPPDIRAELTGIPLPAAPQPVMTYVTAALFVLAAPITAYLAYDTHCGTWYWEPLQSQIIPDTGRYQCVGLGSSDHRFFNDVSDVRDMDQELAEDLKEVEGYIYDYNKEAVKNPSYLTVVYLGQFSSQNVFNYRSELEQLRGVAVAQKESLDDYRPVRVLLANGGDGMDYGEAAAEAIASEASTDDTLLAVVGLGISRTGTEKAIKRLARPDTRIPMIGTVISATKLATNTSSYYHQVGPTNKREAEVGAFYAKTQLGARNAVIYHPDDKDDLYSIDLKEKAKLALEAPDFPVRVESYQVGDSNRAGQDACSVGREGVVFYAGRATQLFAFANGMKSKCQGNYPRFLGGDAVSRFVLDGALNDYPGLTVDYVSQASSLAWGSDCDAAIRDTSFLIVYQALFNNDKDEGKGVCPNTRHGGSLLGHDALQVFIRGVLNAVDQSSPDPTGRPSPEELLRGIEDISSEGSGPLRGASGQIDYPRTVDQAIPKDKAILVLRGQASKELKRVLLCGQHNTAQPPPDNCIAPLGP